MQMSREHPFLFLVLLRALNSMQSAIEDSCSQNGSVLACYPRDYEQFCSRTYFSVALARYKDEHLLGIISLGK